LAAVRSLRTSTFGDYTYFCSQTDNTNTKAWLHKTNLYDNKEKIALAQWLGEYQIEQNYCLYSQWFEGKAKVVSNSLSQDQQLSNAELTSRLPCSIILNRSR
jgi:hypothetical protein